MAGFFDELELRTHEERQEALADELPAVIARARLAPALARALRDVDPERIRSAADLAALPLLRKAELAEAQRKSPPFGGYATRRAAEFDNIFLSRAGIYGPGRQSGNWWRLGRFMHACDIGTGDIVHNCFDYHLTPAGFMIESGIQAVDAAVLPAGNAPLELQVQAARDIGANAYAGPPATLKQLLDLADQQGAPLEITRAAIAGAPLDDALRAEYAARGVAARQALVSADLGLIAYETDEPGAMIVDEGVIVEILHPETGQPVREGETGELVVTTLNPDYPLIRFATGDLVAALPGESPCGRTNMRISGVKGRAPGAMAQP
ncbi:MAG: phenylacetate--CoA ligase family protein [Paracoccus sp. (in: a-proteobacteria)]|nr:phenylacetate--CoA ligase family protein [Paracoccus sp. (in: a-proteobacteria)]